MKDPELEKSILESLGRYTALEIPALIRVCLMERACYTTANEEKLRLALQDLVRRGLVATVRPGCFRIAPAPPPQAAGRSFFRRRLRSG